MQNKKDFLSIVNIEDFNAFVRRRQAKNQTNE
jgi:hypothetical protein